MSKKAVIFDLDGTLAPTMEAIKAHFLHRVQQMRGSAITSYEFASAYHHDLHEFLLNLGITSKQQRMELDQELRILESKQSKAEFFDGIEKLLIFLNNQSVDLYLWTLRFEESTRLILNHNDVLQIFSDIHCGNHEDPKPNPKGMRSKLLLNYDQVYMIGDTVTDMIAAKNINAIAIGVTWANTNSISMLTNNGASFVTDSVELLNQYLKEQLGVR